MGCGIRRNIACHNHLGMISVQVPHRFGNSMIVDPHPVHDGIVPDKAEKTRLWITVLRPCSKGPDLHETESEVRKFVVEFAVLVQASGKTYGIGESYAENFPGKRRMLTFEKKPYHIAAQGNTTCYTKAVKCQFVG